MRQGYWRSVSNLTRVTQSCRFSGADQLAKALRAAGCNTELLVGPDALDQVAVDAEVDMVMAAIVGAVGLAATLAAAKAGKRLLLANKEALVMTGDILMDAARHNGSTLLPIDSEHNAIFQCLPTVKDGISASQFTFVEKSSSRRPVARFSTRR